MSERVERIVKQLLKDNSIRGSSLEINLKDEHIILKPPSISHRTFDLIQHNATAIFKYLAIIPLPIMLVATYVFPDIEGALRLAMPSYGSIAILTRGRAHTSSAN